MKIDYLVVGFGLAGMAFVEELEKAGKSFIVVDNNPNLASRVVGGMYNPIILKRFTPAWHAHQMWQNALPFYKDLEKKFNKQYIYPFEIYRILQSVEEQNNWVVASDKAVMSNYMQPRISDEKIKGIKAPYGFGKLSNVGRVAGELILQDYTDLLKAQGKYLNQTFDYASLNINDTGVEYQNIKANHVVFSEGAYLEQNPFFNYLPMQEAKGEMLFIEVPDLDINFALKSSVFMVPFGNNRYVVGATYNWDDKSFELTDSGKKELEEKLKRFLKLPFKVLGSKVGIRPTVKDRRPMIGRHPKHQNLSVLNGLGTRGIIIAPTIAKALFDYLENDTPIIDEMNINRFKNRSI